LGPAYGRSALSAQLAFRGGRNIALKMSPHQVDQTIAFYRDVLGQHGGTRCAEIERLADGFWDRQSDRIGPPIAHLAEDPGL
jgi:catechol 2,3-dioxygenase-like lactoylglutathione lyase family enzyme